MSCKENKTHHHHDLNIHLNKYLRNEPKKNATPNACRRDDIKCGFQLFECMQTQVLE